MKSARRVVIAAMFAALFSAGAACAETYPTRPVTVIVPFAGGSASDVVTRVVLDRMGTALGQRFVVDNRPGAGGNIGNRRRRQGRRGRLTRFCSAHPAPMAANRSLFKTLGFDPDKDFFADRSVRAFFPISSWRARSCR